MRKQNFVRNKNKVNIKEKNTKKKYEIIVVQNLHRPRLVLL